MPQGSTQPVGVRVPGRGTLVRRGTFGDRRGMGGRAGRRARARARQQQELVKAGFVVDEQGQVVSYRGQKVFFDEQGRVVGYEDTKLKQSIAFEQPIEIQDLPQRIQSQRDEASAGKTEVVQDLVTEKESQQDRLTATQLAISERQQTLQKSDDPFVVKATGSFFLGAVSSAVGIAQVVRNPVQTFRGVKQTFSSKESIKAVGKQFVTEFKQRPFFVAGGFVGGAAITKPVVIAGRAAKVAAVRSLPIYKPTKPTLGLKMGTAGQIEKATLKAKEFTHIAPSKAAKALEQTSVVKPFKSGIGKERRVFEKKTGQAEEFLFLKPETGKVPSPAFGFGLRPRVTVLGKEFGRKRTRLLYTEEPGVGFKTSVGTGTQARAELVKEVKRRRGEILPGTKGVGLGAGEVESVVAPGTKLYFRKTPQVTLDPLGRITLVKEFGFKSSVVKKKPKVTPLKERFKGFADDLVEPPRELAGRRFKPVSRTTRGVGLATRGFGVPTRDFGIAQRDFTIGTGTPTTPPRTTTRGGGIRGFGTTTPPDRPFTIPTTTTGTFREGIRIPREEGKVRRKKKRKPRPAPRAYKPTLASVTARLKAKKSTIKVGETKTGLGARPVPI